VIARDEGKFRFAIMTPSRHAFLPARSRLSDTFRVPLARASVCWIIFLSRKLKLRVSELQLRNKLAKFFNDFCDGER
jgi:hypothetical protein